MSLRLVELVVPEQRVADVDRILDDVTIVDRWCVDLRDGKAGERILVERSRAETLMDELENRFGHMAGFRIVLLDVEATVPDVEEESKDDDPGDDEPETPRLYGRVSRQELTAKIRKATTGTTEYFVMVVLAAVVAMVGLVTNSVAVIIAAMVIAPLLGPNMAIALATTNGDGDLMRRAASLGLKGVSLAFGMSIVVGLIAPDHWLALTGTEFGARANPTPGDFLLALASGVAGCFAFTMGASDTLIGVMVAVALLPPTIVLGMLVGASLVGLALWGEAGGALLLLATNIACVNLAGVLTFRALGVRPTRWWESNRADKTTRRWIYVWATVTVLLVGFVTYRWWPGSSGG